jgi:recombination protein RecT
MENTVMALAEAVEEGGLEAIELGKAIRSIGEDRLDRAYKAALEQNPKLAQCTAESLIGCLLHMLQLDLDLGHVSLIPVMEKNSPISRAAHFIDDQEYICHFRILYKGYVELSRRCGNEPA